MNKLIESEPNNGRNYYFRGIFKWLPGDTSACRDVKIAKNMGFDVGGIINDICGSE